jgi:hypothetical protein
MLSTPNWYATMMEFHWTVKNIMGRFDVPRAVAHEIQHVFPSYEEACKIAAAHRDLCSQVGH